MPEDGGDLATLLSKGRARLAAGDCLAASLLLGQACAVAPWSVEAHFLLGAVQHRLSRLPAALAAFESALELDSAHREAAQARLAVLCQMGRAQEAWALTERLLAQHPDDPQLHYNAAIVRETLGDFAGAVAHYERVLSALPTHRDALLNRGVALMHLGRLGEAYDNNVQLASAYPDWFDAYFNLAEVSLAAARYEEALDACERALTLKRHHKGAALDRGLALAALGRIDEGDAALAHAVALGATPPMSDSGYVASAREIYLIRGYERLETCDWSERETLIAHFREFINDDRGQPLASPALAFRAMMLGLPGSDQLRLARHTAHRYTAIAPRPLGTHTRGAGKRLRIGYVSSDFRDHPTSHLVAPLLERHDRTRFEIHGYSVGTDNDGPHRRRIAAACDRFLDASDVPDHRLAERIAQDGIDVLVNLNGYTTGHHTSLFALRPAPVQVSYLAYPATMGASFIDYLVADPVVIPEAAVLNYSESIAWLPHCYQVNDAEEAIAPPPARADVGLPPSGFIFCDFNQHAKIAPEMFVVWTRILHRVEGSVLWLLDGPGRANLAAHAAAAGIAPARVVFAPRLPRTRHLARLQLGDLFLDTQPTTAHTTALDALLAAVPVVTCSGDAFASRVAASLVRAARLDDLVVGDLAAYEETAVRIARDPARLAVYRRQLREGRRVLPVFDIAGRVRELEWAYGEMVARCRRGSGPVSFSVPTTDSVGEP